MDPSVTRRGFLTRSAFALGTVAACDRDGLLARAAQTRGSQPVGAGGLQESTTPHVIVKLYPGRSEEQKRRHEPFRREAVALGQDFGLMIEYRANRVPFRPVRMVRL